MIQKDEVTHFLTAEAGYTSGEAEAAAADLLVSQPAIQQAFEQWRHTGELPAFAVEGYTAQRLVSEYGFHPVAALLSMDWLLTDPAAASTALRHGFDTVKLAEK